MVGISFHVGSGCMDPPVYAKAIQAARKLFDFAETLGYHFNLLDIGGGFPGDTNTDIKEVKCKQNALICSSAVHLTTERAHIAVANDINQQVFVHRLHRSWITVWTRIFRHQMLRSSLSRGVSMCHRLIRSPVESIRNVKSIKTAKSTQPCITSTMAFTVHSIAICTTTRLPCRSRSNRPTKNCSSHQCGVQLVTHWIR